MKIFFRMATGLLVCVSSGAIFASNALLANTSNFTGISTPQLAATKVDKKTLELMVVGTSDVAAVLDIGQDKLDLKGSVSFSLRSDETSLKNGIVSVSGFNVVFGDVPQELLTYAGTEYNKTGNLTFVVTARQRLKYDAERGVISGKVAGYIGADYMSSQAEPLADSGRDHNRAPRQKAVMTLRMQLSEPFEAAAVQTKPIRQKVNLEVAIEADEDRNIAAQSLTLRIDTSVSVIDSIVAWPWFWEVAQNLCLQPVRIGSLTWNWPLLSVDYTGAGLDFGMPGAHTQWAKADVTFTVRDWKTVWRSDLFNFSTSEAGDLLDEVDDADCVEVYFVEGDSGMHTFWGGGATFSSGSADTKIISSDGNVPPGIDLTHLAHELGHAVDLPHPTGAAGVSTNTLMCPSGFMNDNPARNSQENENNLSNPLLTFSLKLASAGPDCNNSANCGACP